MTNKSNGNRYIGYSEDIEVRYAENIRQLKVGTFGTPFQNIMDDFKIFGEDKFICGILEVTENDKSLMSRRAEHWRKLIQPEYNNHSS